MNGVYFVATPIGNMEEMSERAIDILRNVDVIFCEDTRHSAQLLNYYDINKQLLVYQKFNEKAAAKQVCFMCSQGQNVAVISDAGMPGISDPGRILVNTLKERRIPYTVVSGPSAFANAYVMSGFDAPFTFVGFLPEKDKERQELLDQVNTNGTLIFYSSVHDIKENLDYLYSVLGSRDVCIARELTKMFETITFGKLGEIRAGVQKGEFVIVIDKQQQISPLCQLPIEEHVNHYIGLGQDKMTACKSAAADRGVSKSEIYNALLKTDTAKK